MISTHYDEDHLPGLTELLLKPGTYDEVDIYDQGWPTGTLDNAYLKYLMAINGKRATGTAVTGLGRATRARLTNAVKADGVTPDDPPGAIASLGPPATPVAGTRPTVLKSIDQGPDWMLEYGPAVCGTE